MAARQRRLMALIEEAIFDAHNASERRTAFYTMLDERPRLALRTRTHSQRDDGG